MTTEKDNLSIEIPVQIYPNDDPIDDNDFVPLIIDNGTQTIKSGFKGTNTPKVLYPSIVGEYNKSDRELIYYGYSRESQSNVIVSTDLISLINKYGQKHKYYGNNAINSKRKLLSSYPIKHGIITNWNDIEQIWQNIINDELGIDPSKRAILMTESVLTPKANREKMTQIVFESFETHSFYVGTRQVLALYASGRTTGITLKCGYDSCVVAPIYEGYVEPHAVIRQDFGGNDLTEYLQILLKDMCLSKDIVNDIKEKLCFVSNKTGNGNDKGNINIATKYTLPDGKSMDIDNKILSKCCEALFNPLLMNKKDCYRLDQMTFNSIMKVSVSYRRDLYCNLVLSGGTSLFNGFAERMQKGVKSFAPDSMTVKLIAPTERQFSSWIGGSILGSLSTFQEMWITKEEYDEQGPSIVHQKCT